MLRLISQRTAFIVLVSLAIIFFTHMGMRMIRNSDVPEPNYDVVEFAILSWQDTRSYLTKALDNDLGSARVTNNTAPVLDILVQSYINSMGLLLTALICATIIGLLSGLTISLTKRRRLALLLLAATILGMSLPTFLGGLMLQRAEIFYVSRGGKPLVSIAGFGWDYKHMLLPVLVLAARPVAYLTRASSISLNQIKGEDFIRTAYAKGLSTFRTINGHALRNMAVPFLTAIGVSLRFALSALPVVEFIFVWPGIGLALLRAINQRQTTLVVTLVLALGLTFLGINLLLDMAYWVVDPRIREIE